MRSAHAIARWGVNGLTDEWFPTELFRIGKNEKYLETAIAQSPHLLCLASRRTGIRGPYKAFRQTSLPTPTGRVIAPDIIFLTESGHVVAVEVKLSNNPELRQRDVIAQILDYATSLSRLDQSGLCRLLDREGAANERWHEFVHQCFPDQANVDELAEAYLDRISRGEVNIVIACDKVPPGVAETVKSLSSQASMGFECDVVEIVPFVRGSNTEEILFVPSIRLSTEIVARTSVVVTYRAGDSIPQASVQVTSADEIADAVDVIKSGMRNWSEEEVAREVELSDDSVFKELYQYAKSRSDNGRVVTEGAKQNASFGLHLEGKIDGVRRRRCIFSCPIPWRTVNILFGNVDAFYTPVVGVEFRARIASALGGLIDVTKPMPGITTCKLSEKMTDFMAAFDWLLTNPRIDS